MPQCLSCNVETNNPKFCSRSCARTFHNRKRPKKQRYCHKCGIHLGEGWQGARVCRKCNPNSPNFDNITIGELRAKYNLYQFHAKIRGWARITIKQSGKPKICAICGYDKHAEACHIKPIASFSDDTPISVVNELSNLIYLCPNHHWELDNNLLIF